MKLLANKVVIITGATKGLGLEVAKTFAQHGAKLALCSRSYVDLARVKALIEADKSVPSIFISQLDVSQRQDVYHFVDLVLNEFGRIDILFNNAGIYGPKGLFEDCDISEWIKAIEINLIGSAYVLQSVIPSMKRQGSGKIIQVAGGGAAGNFPRFSAYATSKVGVVRLCEILSSELSGFGVYINSIAPGFMKTRLLDEVIALSPDIVGVDFYKKCLALKNSSADSFFLPCELSLFLASSASDGVTGKFISAVWDSWKLFPSNVDELVGSDVFTIRRIVGRDRDMSLFDL